jgi:hypothetical protein
MIHNLVVDPDDTRNGIGSLFISSHVKRLVSDTKCEKGIECSLETFHFTQNTNVVTIE